MINTAVVKLYTTSTVYKKLSTTYAAFHLFFFTLQPSYSNRLARSDSLLCPFAKTNYYSLAPSGLGTSWVMITSIWLASRVSRTNYWVYTRLVLYYYTSVAICIKYYRKKNSNPVSTILTCSSHNSAAFLKRWSDSNQTFDNSRKHGHKSHWSSVYCQLGLTHYWSLLCKKEMDLLVRGEV